MKYHSLLDCNASNKFKNHNYSVKDIFIPLKERRDSLCIPYLNKGYTKDQIFVTKPFNEVISITKNNIKDFKNIKVIIGNAIIRGINDLRVLRVDEISGNFDCYLNKLNKLTSLEGGPTIVNGYFSCSNNNLTSLEGSPVSVNGNFSCSNNKLTSLEGCLSTIGGNFNCSNNILTSLDGGPVIVNGFFDCSYNRLTSLEGTPSIIRGDFNISNNLKKFTEKEVRHVIDIKGEVYV